MYNFIPFGQEETLSFVNLDHVLVFTYEPNADSMIHFKDGSKYSLDQEEAKNLRINLFKLLPFDILDKLMREDESRSK